MKTGSFDLHEGVLDSYEGRISIDLDHLAHNVHEIKRILNEKTMLMAVVKANAYGHGLVEISQALQKLGITHFAVAELREAVALRNAGITGQILHTGVTIAAQAETLIQFGITASICRLEDAVELDAVCRNDGKNIAVHVRMDQGLGTVGIDEGEFLHAVQQIHLLKHLRIEGIYTQIPGAYQSHQPFVAESLQRFRKIGEQLKQSILPNMIMHAASSPIFLNHPEAQFDLVRSGILLFGLKCYGSAQLDLKPVMRLSSSVIRVHPLKHGEPYGYDGEINMAGDRKVAIIQIGYGNCHFLFARKTGDVLIRGMRAPIMGRGTMDHLMVDVTDIDAVQPGDEAVLIGEQFGKIITAEEVAEQSGYHEMNAECVTLAGAGLARFYLKGGKIDAS